MRQKDIAEIKKLNKRLREFTDRYNLSIDVDSSIFLYDNSLQEDVVRTLELSYIKPYVDGFILGRETQG